MTPEDIPTEWTRRVYEIKPAMSQNQYAAAVADAYPLIAAQVQQPADAQVIDGLHETIKHLRAELASRNVLMSAAMRRMLAFALDTTQEVIWAGEGFTDDDQAALDTLRILTTAAGEGQ